jgi:hypothetical protein
LAILEVISYGVPVVATPAGGIQDAIARKGQAGSSRSEIKPHSELRFGIGRRLRLALGSAARAKAEQLGIAHYSERPLRVYRSFSLQQTVGAIRGRYCQA